MQHTKPNPRAFDMVGTSAFTSLKAGIHPKIVQERLGHSTVGITLNIYSHTNPTLHAEAAEQIAGLILD